MGVAVGRGPLLLVVRAALRAAGGKRLVTRWQRAATWGLGAGLMAGTGLAGAALGGQTAVTAAVLGLAVLLFSMDLAWRWLPMEWTLPLLSLGLVAGFLGDRTAETLAGAAVGGGILLALQIIFRRLRGVEALGTGDIWLTAGLGCFSGPATIAWVLGLAALSGLAADTLRKAVRTTQNNNRWGVAFGSHIIAVYLIVSAL